MRFTRPYFASRSGELRCFGQPLGARHWASAGTPVVLVGDLTPGDDGSTPYVCGVAGNPCDTIQHGIDHAGAGDTISVGTTQASTTSTSQLARASR